jgi:hypothetical protein
MQSKDKGDNGAWGDGGKSKGYWEETTRSQVLVREVFKVSDLFRLETLLEYCVETFRRGLKVDAAVEELVWVHLFGSAEARKVLAEYLIGNDRSVQVGSMCCACAQNVLYV